jgi:hypothetical protein
MPKNEYGNPHKAKKSKPKRGAAKVAADAFVRGATEPFLAMPQNIGRIAKAIERKPLADNVKAGRAPKRKPGLVKAIDRKPGLPIVKAVRRGETPAQKLGKRSAEAFTKADRAKGRAEGQQQEKRQARAMKKAMRMTFRTISPKPLKEYKPAKLMKPIKRKKSGAKKRSKQVMAADRHPM